MHTSDGLLFSTGTDPLYFATPQMIRSSCSRVRPRRPPICLYYLPEWPRCPGTTAALSLQNPGWKQGLGVRVRQRPPPRCLRFLRERRAAGRRSAMNHKSPCQGHHSRAKKLVRHVSRPICLHPEDSRLPRIFFCVLPSLPSFCRLASAVKGVRGPRTSS